jgi:hypothetical protein
MAILFAMSFLRFLLCRAVVARLPSARQVRSRLPDK